MIPLRLQIKNFLSYGSELQTIDFGTYNLICLSGKNGHGKSALLDAITWAIWGYARKTVGAAKADQGLVRLGQNNMLVYLDFACNDMHYRIRRELSMHHSKPVAALDFGVVQHDGSTISLTDKTIRATQEKIERTIRLDFESFCNSTFLRQGQSNEFCKKSPKERKDILTRILGLEQYEIIRQLALEKAKKLLAERQQVLLLQESIKTEIEAKEQVRAQHVQLLATITTTAATIAQHEEILKQQKNAHASLAQQEQLYAVDRFALEQASTHMQEAYERLRILRKDWKQTHKQLITTNNYEQLKKDLDILTIASRQHQATFQKMLQLKEQYLLKKQELQQFESDWQKGFQQQLQQEKNIYAERLLRNKQYEAEIARIIAQQHEITGKQQRTHQEIATVTRQISDLQALMPYYETQKKDLDRRKEAYQRYGAEGSIRTQQLKELRHKQALATKTQEASCPLCEQTVSASRRRFLELKYIKEERFLTHRIQRLAALVTRLKQTMIEQYTALEPLEKKIHARSVQEAELHMHTQTLKTLTQEAAVVHTQLSTMQQQFIATQAELKQQMASITQYEATEKTKLQLEQRHIGLKKEIGELERAAKELQYNKADHTHIEERRRTAQQMIDQHMHIINQRPLQEDRKKQMSALCLQIRQLIHKKNELLKKIEPTHDLKKQLEQLDITIGGTTTQLKATYATKEHLFQQKGALDAQLQKIALYEEKQSILSAEIAQKMVHYHDLTAIAHAMSKDGIQALLIEDVIPDIEHEANELLSRLTNNQAHIIIESLKDLKSGKTKETLDIFISDGLGIRPYELFSGGEAFRIDFALRIAISKLVARKAGTALQTLIIDEGFGSQDEEGLTLIMDAIHAIQHDFEKIIIVSHLPFMKDQFPVHFNIEKGPLGSTIAVLHQG